MSGGATEVFQEVVALSRYTPCHIQVFQHIRALHIMSHIRVFHHVMAVRLFLSDRKGLQLSERTLK